MYFEKLKTLRSRISSSLRFFYSHLYKQQMNTLNKKNKQKLTIVTEKNLRLGNRQQLYKIAIIIILFPQAG